MATNPLVEALRILSTEGKRHGVTWADAAIKSHYRGNVENFKALMRSDQANDRDTVKLVLSAWRDLIRDKQRALDDVRGESPKSAPPPKANKVVANSSSETIGLTEQERLVVLHAHNDARRQYGAGPLEYDERLASHAQAWAIHLAQKFVAGHRRLDHNEERRVDGLNGITGENLVYRPGRGSANTLGHEWPVASWVAEVKDYDLAKKMPKNTNMTGHFTQVVWKSTTKVGCGFALINMPDGTWHAIWACNYHPAGNYVGQHEQNVGEHHPH